MPFDMPIRRRFSPLAFGSSLLLVVVLWKVILPSGKPVALHVGAEEEWVDSLELFRHCVHKEYSQGAIEPWTYPASVRKSNGYRGNLFRSFGILIKQSNALCWANGTMSSVVSLLWFGRFREVYCF